MGLTVEDVPMYLQSQKVEIKKGNTRGEPPKVQPSKDDYIREAFEEMDRMLRSRLDEFDMRGLSGEWAAHQSTFRANIPSEQNRSVAGLLSFDERTFEKIRRAAHMGLDLAQYFLGECYYHGSGGVKQEYAEAVKWFRRAVQRGEVHACDALGQCYEKGHGVKQDAEEALRCWLEAADKGFVKSQLLLARAYAHGLSNIKTDIEKAVYWYRRAAENGFAEAQLAVGVCCRLGEGVPRDDMEAQVWLCRAAVQGIAAARRILSAYWFPSECVIDFDTARHVLITLGIALKWDNQPESQHKLGPQQSGSPAKSASFVGRSRRQSSPISPGTAVSATARRRSALGVNDAASTTPSAFGTPKKEYDLNNNVESDTDADANTRTGPPQAAAASVPQGEDERLCQAFVLSCVPDLREREEKELLGSGERLLMQRYDAFISQLRRLKSHKQLSGLPVQPGGTKRQPKKASRRNKGGGSGGVRMPRQHGRLLQRPTHDLASPAVGQREDSESGDPDDASWGMSPVRRRGLRLLESSGPLSPTLEGSGDEIQSLGRTGVSDGTVSEEDDVLMASATHGKPGGGTHSKIFDVLPSHSRGGTERQAPDSTSQPGRNTGGLTVDVDNIEPAAASELGASDAADALLQEVDWMVRSLRGKPSSPVPLAHETSLIDVNSPVADPSLMKASRSRDKNHPLVSSISRTQSTPVGARPQSPSVLARVHSTPLAARAQTPTQGVGRVAWEDQRKDPLQKDGTANAGLDRIHGFERLFGSSFSEQKQRSVMRASGEAILRHMDTTTQSEYDTRSRHRVSSSLDRTAPSGAIVHHEMSADDLSDDLVDMSETVDILHHYSDIGRKMSTFARASLVLDTYDKTLDELKRKERQLQEQRTSIVRERNRGPEQRWWERKDPTFHREAEKHNRRLRVSYPEKPW
eukprot:Rmarinus@m.28013